MTDNCRKLYQPFPTGLDTRRYGDDPEKQTALLCIDLQQLNCVDNFGVFADHRRSGVSESAIRYYLERVQSTVLPNVSALQRAFRDRGFEVIHVRIQSLTRDGRDRSLEHKRLGLHAPPGSQLAEFMDAVRPGEDEIIINKTASGVFGSTNLEYLLRNLYINRVFIVGVFTNECISSAVRSASDLGFDVWLVSDATAAITPELHDATILTTDGRYARVKTTAAVLQSCREEVN